MTEVPTDPLVKVADYYATRLREHGATPKGVDWNGQDGQYLRFEQLARIVTSSNAFSLNDLGCGYGALLQFLESKFASFNYAGWDISAEMIATANQLSFAQANARFFVGGMPADVADYGIASGIFNVRLDCAESRWRDYIEDTLHVLDRTSRLGFAFNCLTRYSDAEKMRDYLYYADPGYWFDLCKRKFSRQVALLHDYGLYEFTILVRKPS